MFAPDDRQGDALVQLLIAHNRLRLITRSNHIEVLEETLPHHDDATIASAEMLALAISDRALTDPADKILVHDVAGNPPSSLLIDDRRIPVGYAVLHIRLP